MNNVAKLVHQCCEEAMVVVNHGRTQSPYLFDIWETEETETEHQVLIRLHHEVRTVMGRDRTRFSRHPFFSGHVFQGFCEVLYYLMAKNQHPICGFSPVYLHEDRAWGMLVHVKL